MAVAQKTLFYFFKTVAKLFLEVNKVSIDNATFKLFYKATTSLLMAFAFVASSKQFFGDPITCEVVKEIFGSD